jgi:hypothetical protein
MDSRAWALFHEMVCLPLICGDGGTNLRASYQPHGRFMRPCVSSLGFRNAGWWDHVLLSQGAGPEFPAWGTGCSFICPFGPQPQQYHNISGGSCLGFNISVPLLSPGLSIPGSLGEYPTQLQQTPLGIREVEHLPGFLTSKIAKDGEQYK